MKAMIFLLPLMILAYDIFSQTNKISITKDDFQYIAHIRWGLNYPIWDQKPSNCKCESVTIDKGCLSFCRTLKSLKKINRIPQQVALNQTLRYLNKYASEFIDSNGQRNEGTEDILSWYGAAVCLYLFNTPKEDQLILISIRNNHTLLRMFFDVHKGNGEFGWFYNRPDRKVWSDMIDSCNGRNKDWYTVYLKSSFNDSIMKAMGFDTLLYNPFRDTFNPIRKFTEDSIKNTLPIELIIKEL